MAFVNTAVIKYPIDEVFSLFIRTAKRDFPKFDMKNPVGTKVKKKVGYYSTQSTEMTIEITKFEKNKIYEIVSDSITTLYTSTYEFEKVDEESTRVTLTEDGIPKKGIITWVNRLIQTIAFKGRVKRRFTYFIENLAREIEERREKLAKNSKSRADEEKKIVAKAEARKAKAEALKAKKEADELKRAAEKALREAQEAEEKANAAAMEAEDDLDDLDDEAAIDETISDEETKTEEN